MSLMSVPRSGGRSKVAGEGLVAPPASNTGAQRTTDQPTANRVLVDWVSFTVKASVDQVCGFLGMDEWVELDRGGLGYRRCRVAGAVRVYYDGGPDMGTHVVIPGSGCRELEARGVVRDWRKWIGEVLAFGGKITRLDVAWDDVEGMLDLLRMLEYVRRRYVVTRFRRWKVDISGTFDGSERGMTLTFGSRQSNTYVRIYDKGGEQGVCGHWVRVELELKDDRAQCAAETLYHRGISEFAGILRSAVDFVEPSNDSNRRRWAPAAWWARFLGFAEKARLAVAPVVRSLERTVAWIERQVAPALATVFIAGGGDLDVLLSFVHNGRKRLRWHHRMMLAEVGATWS